MRRGVQRLNNKRNEKLEDLYKKHAKSLYYYLYQISGSSVVAEDLVQETFYKATISLSFYRDYEVKSWLFKVARHAYLDEWRKRQRWEWVPFIDSFHKRTDMLSPFEQPERAITNKESENELKILLNQLNERYRTILYLREIEELPYKAIGVILDMNENQVKVTLHRARNRKHKLATKQFYKERNE